MSCNKKDKIQRLCILGHYGAIEICFIIIIIIIKLGYPLATSHTQYRMRYHCSSLFQTACTHSML